MIKQAVILAGGEGTRLRPLTYEMPKPLVPVQGVPILTWLVRWLKRYDVEKALVIIPPKWQTAFERWKQDAEQVLPIELWVEPEPMGTMGAMAHHLKDYFNGESVFVTNGDELKGFDLRALAKTHEEGGYGATLGLVRVASPKDYGIPDLDGTRATRYREKPEDPSTDLAHAGLYALNTSCLQKMNREEKFLMFEKDLFPDFASQGLLGGCPLEGPWFDCGTMERWEKAIKEWREPNA